MTSRTIEKIEVKRTEEWNSILNCNRLKKNRNEMKIDGSIGKRLSVSFLSAFRTYCVRAWRINIDQVRSFECLQCMQRCNQNNIDCEHTLGILCEYIWAFRKACFKASSKSFWWCCSFLQQLWLAFSISFRWAFGNCVHKFSWKFIWIKEAKEKKRKENTFNSNVYKQF